MRPMKNLQQVALERAYIAMHQRQNQVGLILTALLAQKGGTVAIPRAEIDSAVGKDVSWEMTGDNLNVWIGKPNTPQNGSPK